MRVALLVFTLVPLLAVGCTDPLAPAPVTAQSARTVCRAPDGNAPQQGGVPDDRVLQAVRSAANDIATHCREGEAPVPTAAVVSAAQRCLGASAGASTRFDVCVGERCCGIGIATRRVTRDTDDSGDWMILRAGLQQSDYEDFVYWMSRSGRLERMCRWAPYSHAQCFQGDLDQDPSWTGCDMTPVQWSQTGETTRRFLCQTAL